MVTAKLVLEVASVLWVLCVLATFVFVIDVGSLVRYAFGLRENLSNEEFGPTVD